MLRKFVVLAVGGLVIVASIGVGFLLRGDRPAGVFLLVMAPLFACFYLVLFWASSRRIGSRPEPTGRILVPASSGAMSWSASQQAWTWTGGGNVPTGIGRMNATAPLALLELRQDSLTLRFRPRSISTSLGGNERRWQLDDVTSVYPVRGRWVPFHRGIAVEATAERCYFWTLRPEPILTILCEQGYPVSWAEHYFKLLS